MSRRDVTVTLRQMLDYSQKAIALSRGRKRSDLDEDLTFNLALTRLIEIIGEAKLHIEFLKSFARIILRFPGWKLLACETA
jgi:uncharacterized protein with HEPN domain